MAKIKVSHVCYAYDNHGGQVLEDVSIRIRDGEFICVLGQSGCGKTTFLRLLAGLETPSGGEIRVDGQPVRGPRSSLAGEDAKKREYL